MKVSKLKANSVRGIPNGWPDLPIQDKGMIIYGHNGVGKSSVIDAIEFALSLKSTLFAETRQGVNWDTASPHVLHGDPNITVVVKDGGAEHPITSGQPRPEISDAGHRWLNAAQSSNFVLRRHMLLEFITKAPANRYQMLTPFFNMAEFERVETGLAGLLERLNGQKTNNESGISALRTKMGLVFGAWPQGEVTQAMIYDWLNTDLQSLGVTACVNQSDLARVKEELQTELGGQDKAERLGKFVSLKQQAQQLPTKDTITAEIADIRNALVALRREMDSVTGQVITEFLQEGYKVLAERTEENCPFCEQPVNKSELLLRIRQRIDADQKVSAEKAKVQLAANKLKATLSSLRRSLERFITDWRNMSLQALSEAYNDSLQSLVRLDAILNGAEYSAEDFEPFLQLADTFIYSHEASIAILDAYLTQEGAGDRRTILAKALSKITSIETDWVDYSRRINAHAQIVAEIGPATKLHAHAVSARKETVQEILKAVSSVANAYYDHIHPNEQIGNSNLTVRTAGQGSVEVATNFYGTLANPLRYFSESHLDTLGLCYFLALRRHEANLNPIFKLLILDDVMHSVDAEHRGRVATLLKAHFSDFQLIITTHDIYFYNLLQQQLGSGYSYHKLTSWDVTTGPRFGSPSTDLDKITNPEIRTAIGLEDLSAACGRFFEWMLKELTEQLQVPLQARFKRNHDIGNMWPATKSKLNSHRSFGTDAQCQSVVGNIDTNLWVRNACGAHHNEEASGAVGPEVVELASHLTDLYAATFCNSCRSWICYQRDGSWKCDCGGKHYTNVTVRAA